MWWIYNVMQNDNKLNILKKKPLNLDQQQALENNIMTNLGEEKFMLCMCMHTHYFTKTLWPSCLRQNKNNFQDQALQLSVVTLIGGTINVWFFMYVLVLCIFLMSLFYFILFLQMFNVFTQQCLKYSMETFKILWSEFNK